MKNDLRYVSFSDVDVSYLNTPSDMKSRNGIKRFKKDLETCILCKAKKCIVDYSKNKVYSGRITRSITRWLNYINSFIVIEVYKSMPLLGGEENIPNWDVHLVHYSIVFSEKYK